MPTVWNYNDCFNKSLIYIICFLLVSNSLRGQASAEKAIVDFYSKPTDNLKQQGTSKYVIYLKDSIDGDIFKDQFFYLIKRTISDKIFVVETNESWPDVYKNLLRECKSSNDFWKLFTFSLPDTVLFKSPRKQKFTISYSNRSILDSIIREFPDVVKLIGENVGLNIIQVSCDFPFLIEHFLELNEINSIEYRLIKPSAESPLPGFEPTLNSITLLQTEQKALDGDGLNVSVKEDALNNKDIDFQGRVITSSTSSQVSSSHATSIASLIAGGGNSSSHSTGVATGASLLSNGYGNLFPDSLDYSRFHVSVQNHSYGVGIENYYGADAAAYDMSTIQVPSLVHVFSSGNKGLDTSIGGNYNGLPGVSNITGSFKMSKNTIAVGAQDGSGQASIGSSRGPAFDGRIKPELVAFGSNGSSEAAAIVSGTAVLMQQAYSKKHQDSLPSNALIKAVLINSCDDIGEYGPHFETGYGSLNAKRSVDAILSRNFFDGTVDSSLSQRFTLSVPPNIRLLKITLVWTDPPAKPFAVKALVNDLDLELFNSSGMRWLPWVLNTNKNSDSLKLPAIRGLDSINVVEQITVLDPEPGNYFINIHGRRLHTANQSYSVCYSLSEQNRFRWNFPAKGNLLHSGKITNLRWSSTYPAQKGLLSTSLDKGKSWQLVNSELDLTTSSYSYLVSDTNSFALFKMKIGNEEFISDTSFVSSSPNIQLAYDCEDSLMIFWHPISSISKYAVFSLGNKYMEEIATTSDTFLVIPKNKFKTAYLSVAPLIDGRHKGVSSATLERSAQGLACYIRSFLADLTNSASIQLTIALGTIPRTARVVFEKKIGGKWLSIKSFMEQGTTVLSFADQQLVQGLNIYRAKIELDPSRTFFSDQLEVFYFGDKEVVFYPNPVSKLQQLFINVREPLNKRLVILDLHARIIFDKQLSPTISLSTLPPGIYTAQIFDGSKRVTIQKIIVY